MIYFFVRYVDGAPVETTSCEDWQRRAGIEARGYTRCGYAVWDAARAELDEQTIARMGGPPRERAVGEPLLKTMYVI